MQYTIIRHDSVDTMCRHINALMADGWVALGGVAVVTDPRADAAQPVVYCQAMRGPSEFEQCLTALVKATDA